MPNWVTNILTIYGKTEDVKAMFDRAKADKRNIFTMESFKPMPKTFYETDTTNGVFVTERQFIDEYKKENGCEPVGEVLESLKAKALKKWEAARKYQEKKYGVVGWYDWRRYNLGTKWDADLIKKDEFYQRIENESFNGEVALDIVFDTAWCPPFEWLLTVVRNNPNIRCEMWCDEESGYKFYYEGADGMLSEDLSGELYDRYVEKAKNTSVDDLISYSEQDENSLMANMLRNDYAREYIINNLFACGYWDRNGWTNGFSDYAYNQLEYILDDFITTYLYTKTGNEFETVANDNCIVLSEDKLKGIRDDEMRKELIRIFSREDYAVETVCNSGEYEKGFLLWLSEYDPQADNEDDDAYVG